jgi:hypothetical protein
MDYVDDSLVETLWHDLDGKVSRQQIARAATEIAAKYEKAIVTAFVPIFIHRQALEQLKGWLASPSQMSDSRAPVDDE